MEPASDLGTLGGTRIPNRLIRSYFTPANLRLETSSPTPVLRPLKSTEVPLVLLKPLTSPRRRGAWTVDSAYIHEGIRPPFACRSRMVWTSLAGDFLRSQEQP